MLCYSTVQQSESTLCLHTSPLSQISFPFSSPQSTDYSFQCATVGSDWSPVLCLVLYTCQFQ